MPQGARLISCSVYLLWKQIRITSVYLRWLASTTSLAVLLSQRRNCYTSWEGRRGGGANEREPILSLLCLRTAWCLRIFTSLLPKYIFTEKLHVYAFTSWQKQLSGGRIHSVQCDSVNFDSEQHFIHFSSGSVKTPHALLSHVVYAVTVGDGS